MQNVPAIKIERLTKFYHRSNWGVAKSFRGVEDISFSVSPGEIFGLLGPNGSGKTTIIKLMLGLLYPTAGRAQINGRDISDVESRKDLGYLPEVPYFYRYLTAHEVLKFYGGLSQVPGNVVDQRIRSALERVRMLEFSGRPMREYSKGMLQRVGLAQTLLHDPSILILDEPVTGLDPVGLREMRELLLDLNRQGKTIFFSSHSISEVERICTRAAILVKGRLARIAEQSEWKGRAGRLEDIFVEAVQSFGPVGVQ